MESKAPKSSSDIIYTNIHISFERGEAREEQTDGENVSYCSSARDGNEEEKKRKPRENKCFAGELLPWNRIHARGWWSIK